MIFIEKDQLYTDDFIVLDEDDNPVIGLVEDDFAIELYNPDKDQVANISGGITVSIVEVGDGIYRILFTPNELGNWTLIISHNTYFPFGKGQNYKCVETSISSVNILVKRILGLSQENFRIFNPVYIIKNKESCMTSATLKIYPTAADVDTDTNVIAEYAITATYNNDAEMITNKVKRVV